MRDGHRGLDSARPRRLRKDLERGRGPPPRGPGRRAGPHDPEPGRRSAGAASSSRRPSPQPRPRCSLTSTTIRRRGHCRASPPARHVADGAEAKVGQAQPQPGGEGGDYRTGAERATATKAAVALNSAVDLPVDATQVRRAGRKAHRSPAGRTREPPVWQLWTRIGATGRCRIDRHEHSLRTSRRDSNWNSPVEFGGKRLT